MLAQEWRSGCFPMRARAMAKGVHSKADAVYAELKESILSGALEPGCLIDKADLCARLGVSRVPVSAAVSKPALTFNLKQTAAAVDADDKAVFYRFDVAFHQTLASGLGLLRASEVLDGLRAHLERVRRLMLWPAGRMKETLREHAAIVEAVEAADPAAAREAMKRHLGATGAQLDIIVRQRPEMFSP